MTAAQAEPAGTGRVAGKRAIVTGGANGIGRATAMRLAAEGAKVTITDVDHDQGQAAAAEIGEGTTFLGQDVRQEEDWHRVIADVTARDGGLDILVNNAGILGTQSHQTIEHLDLEEWRLIQAINVEGVFLGCRFGIDAMKAGGGAIVNLSSIAGLLASPHVAAYGASKGAVRQLTKSVAVHCGRAGYRIRCNSVHPGVIKTAMGDQVMGIGGIEAAAGWAARLKMIPLGEPGLPDDIANAILFLVSDEARYITGAELVIDGGTTII